MTYPQIQYLGPAHADLATTSGASARELDSRSSDGIHVRLLWHPHDARISVAVHDTKTGDAFALPVPDGSRALDVFHHPYAYADSRAPALPTAPSAAAASQSRHTQSSRAHNKAS